MLTNNERRHYWHAIKYTHNKFISLLKTWWNGYLWRILRVTVNIFLCLCTCCVQILWAVISIIETLAIGKSNLFSWLAKDYFSFAKIQFWHGMLILILLCYTLHYGWCMRYALPPLLQINCEVDKIDYLVNKMLTISCVYQYSLCSVYRCLIITKTSCVADNLFVCFLFPYLLCGNTEHMFSCCSHRVKFESLSG